MQKSPTKSRKIVVEKSCGVVLYRNFQGRKLFLLLHYPSGHWDFPKGHVEERDASEQETASRELFEETGIEDIRFLEGFCEVMHYEFGRGKKELVSKKVVYFLGETTESEIKISHEHQNFDWLPYEEANRRLTFDNARQILQKAHRHLTSS